MFGSCVPCNKQLVVEAITFGFMISPNAAALINLPSACPKKRPSTLSCDVFIQSLRSFDVNWYKGQLCREQQQQQQQTLCKKSKVLTKSMHWCFKRSFFYSPISLRSILHASEPSRSDVQLSGIISHLTVVQFLSFVTGVFKTLGKKTTHEHFSMPCFLEHPTSMSFMKILVDKEPKMLFQQHPLQCNG